MNTVSAQDLDRRGTAALKEALKKGPVHIVEGGLPIGMVVVSEEEFQRGSGAVHPPKAGGRSLLQEMIEKPATGNRTREEIDADLQALRDEWDDRR